MTTYVVTDYDGCDYITAGKRYEAEFICKDFFKITDDNGNEIIARVAGISHLKGRNWTVIEEPDTPKTWGEMTDAEKGALLLAHHEGKTIQAACSADDWLFEDLRDPHFKSPDMAYRIKPESVVGEMAFGGKYTDCSGVFSMPPRDSDTHTLTLPTLDGKLVTGEFANEDGMKVVIEEKK